MSAVTAESEFIVINTQLFLIVELEFRSVT